MTGSEARRILLFGIEAGVVPHLATLVVVGRFLRDLGHEVLLPRCPGMFRSCIPKDSVLVPPDDTSGLGLKICSQCIKRHDDLVRTVDMHGIRVLDLQDVITPEVRDLAELVVGTAEDDPGGLSLDGCAIGALSLHDLLLNYKLLKETPRTDKDRAYLKNSLTMAVSIYEGVWRYIRRQGITDVVVYGNYASNGAAVLAARQVGIAVTFIASINHCGVDRRFLHINRTHLFDANARMIAHWPVWRDRPMEERDPHRTGNDIIFRLGGNGMQTYSPGRTMKTDVRVQLGLDTARRLIVCYTSSLDEYNAEDQMAAAFGSAAPAPQRPFQNQVEWLLFMADLVARDDTLQMVIRIHPREDSNKRDPLTSQHLAVLRQALANLPANVKVVWPRDPVSSYDLMEVADLVQTWSSTVGLESARLGVPVVKANHGYASYPEGDFALGAPTRPDFAAAVRQALDWQPDLDRLILAHRYYAYSRFVASVDLGDVSVGTMDEVMGQYKAPRNLATVGRAVLDGIPVWEDKLDIGHTSMAPESERHLVQLHLRRILDFLITGTDLRRNLTIVRRPAGVPAEVPQGAHAVFQDDGRSYTYTTADDGAVYRKYSPMCIRLARLCGLVEPPSIPS